MTQINVHKEALDWLNQFEQQWQRLNLPDDGPFRMLEYIKQGLSLMRQPDGMVMVSVKLIENAYACAGKLQVSYSRGEVSRRAEYDWLLKEMPAMEKIIYGVEVTPAARPRED